MSLKIEFLENSFEKIKPQANDFVASFYENLFIANPEVKPLFAHTDMKLQQKMLLSSLVMVVENLRQPDVLNKSLRGIGSAPRKIWSIAPTLPVNRRCAAKDFSAVFRSTVDTRN